MSEEKRRLVTRADFDGVVCGALFNELDMIGDIVFAEPSDMQQGRFPVSDKDISANLPCGGHPSLLQSSHQRNGAGRREG